MNPVFPFDIQQDHPGCYISFPDVPGALSGDDSAESATAGAMDCLVSALEGIIHLKQELPVPSRARQGQGTVTLPPLVVAKLGLYQAMREHGLTKSALGRRLGVSEMAVRRLLNLRHQSHIGHVEHALLALGKQLRVSVLDAA
ncbi:MAG: hypothetical protein HQL66_10225 [Magnetococcales bacterium]|nr:hypothetical protein [Magnetococcales bacterium]